MPKLDFLLKLLLTTLDLLLDVKSSMNDALQCNRSCSMRTLCLFQSRLTARRHSNLQRLSGRTPRGYFPVPFALESG